MNFVKNINLKNTNNYWALLLCILPILDPYAINSAGSIMIVNVIVVFVALFAALSKKISMNKTLFGLLLYFLCSSLISGMFTRSASINLVLEFKVLVAQILLLIAFSYLWRCIEKEKFYKFVVNIGVACALLAIIQYMAVFLGFGGFYDGKLPFYIGDNNAFNGLIDMKSGNIRVHSFFEEPSYLGIFELPVFAYCMKNKKFICAAIVGAACFITSTLLGLIGLVIVVVYCILFDASLPKRQKILVVFFVLVFLFLLIFLANTNSAIENMFQYYTHRFTNVERDFEREDSSLSLRLFGNIAYFNEYPLFNKIFGVGINQYVIYFNIEQDYSNDIVSLLLDFGICGLIALIITLMILFFKINSEGKIYFIIFVMVMMVDHIWFNIYFFYLLTWCVFHFKIKDDFCLIV